MPQSKKTDESAASAAPPILAGLQRGARPTPAVALAADSACLRCRACGGLSPLFLSGCVDCGEPMRGEAAAGALTAVMRHVTLSLLVLVLLMLGAWLFRLVA
jgi:hypothetical protein